jgi:hypothetical protein
MLGQCFVWRACMPSPIDPSNVDNGFNGSNRIKIALYRHIAKPHFGCSCQHRGYLARATDNQLAFFDNVRRCAWFGELMRDAVDNLQRHEQFDD